MDNKMAEVAKLLGVELDEVFFVKGCSGCYTYYSKTYLKFTESGLKESVNRTSWHSAVAQVVDDIFYENFSCKHCVFNEKGRPCSAPFNDCVEGIKEWLQRDDKSIAEKA